MAIVPQVWNTLLYRHPYQVTAYWRAFVGKPLPLPTDDTEWTARVRLCELAAREAYEALDSWIAALAGGLDHYQKLALAKVVPHLARVGALLDAVKLQTEGTSDRAALWVGAVLPLTVMPGSAWDGITSVRNQLLQIAAPPAETIITSSHNADWLPDWGAPSWPADWFQRKLAEVWSAAEHAAPGEPPSAADVTQATLDGAVAAAVAAYDATVAAAGKAAGAVGSAAKAAAWPVAGVAAAVGIGWLVLRGRR